MSPTRKVPKTLRALCSRLEGELVRKCKSGRLEPCRIKNCIHRRGVASKCIKKNVTTTRPRALQKTIRYLSLYFSFRVGSGTDNRKAAVPAQSRLATSGTNNLRDAATICR